jgi:hypothetical protein
MDSWNAIVSQLLSSLPIEQRAERYRQYAARAVARAQTASEPDQRAEFFAIAANWHTMALEVERFLAGPLPEVR